MRKNSPLALKQFKLFLTTIVLIIFFINRALAQDSTTACAPSCDKVPPLPQMWVSDSAGDKRIRYFEIKHRKLNRLFKKENSYIYCSIKSFKDLTDSLRRGIPYTAKHEDSLIYAFVATLPGSKYQFVPRKQGKKLTLIFASGKRYSKPTSYYIILEDGTVQRIDPTLAQSWEDNFVNKRMRRILSTINSDDDDNLTSDGKLSDTRLMAYEYKNWEEFFIKEVNYQKSIGVEVSGIKAFFSAFTETGDLKNRYRKRLHVIYNFTKLDEITNRNVPFSIDKEACFKCRYYRYLATLPGETQKLLKDGGGGADNGQLCPPASGCPIP